VTHFNSPRCTRAQNERPSALYHRDELDWPEMQDTEEPRSVKTRWKLEN
jgi:hypothetical protein